MVGNEVGYKSNLIQVSALLGEVLCIDQVDLSPRFLSFPCTFLSQYAF